MALWQGTSINSNETAKVFNQLAEKRSIPMVVKLNSLLYAFMGKDDGTNPSTPNVRQVPKITGNKYEVGLMGKLPSPAGISDGASEIASASLTYVSDIFGAAEFSMAHYGFVHPVPESEVDRFRGSEAKTLSYIDDVMTYLEYGYENKLATDLHASAAPSRTALGGWQYAVADDNTYGTIDRTDSGNADFRGVVCSSFGDTTLDKIQAQAINVVRGNMGKVNVGVAGTTLYSKIQKLVQPYSIVNYSEDTAKFGSDHVAFAGIKFLMDQRTTDGVIGLLDTRWWDLVRKDLPFTDTGMVFDFTKVSTYIINTRLWVQLVCKKPNANAKITGAF